MHKVIDYSATPEVLWLLGSLCLVLLVTLVVAVYKM
jgi:hypothetical protein